MVDFLKGVFYLAVGLMALLFLSFFVFSFSAANASDYFDGCQARVLEHNLDGSRAISFTDRCMGSFGYRKSRNCSQELYPVSECYHPRWIFWAK